MHDRHSPLHRLRKAKLTLLAVVSTFAGLALLFLVAWAEGQPGWGWLGKLPAGEVGSGLLFAGLFGVLFEYVGQRDAEEAHIGRIRQVITEDLAAKPDGLVSMVSAETRDRIIGNCLGVQLGDGDLAADVYGELREQVIGVVERRYDMDVSVALAPWEHGGGEDAMFVATIRWEYRTKTVEPRLRFACVSDIDEYRELLQDPSCTVVHYFEPQGEFDAASADAFQLLQFSLDGRELPARRVSRAGAQHYTVSLGQDTVAGGREVTLSYTYRVLVKQHGHLLHLDVSRPTKGLKVQLAYNNCGIRHVNVLDYIASARQPRVSRLPSSDPTPLIEVDFDGWVFPKAGVAFVWVLEGEAAVREPVRADAHVATHHKSELLAHST